MADEKSPIFTQKAAEKLRSPDDLDEYVRVTNPSVWVVLGACAILLIGLFAWGFLGTAETSVAAVGASVKGEVVCFLPTDKATIVHVGDVANVNGELMKVTSVSSVPVSPAEARDIVGADYLVSTLVTDEWTYVVRFSQDDGDDNDPTFSEGVPLHIAITIERIPPITLLFGDDADA